MRGLTQKTATELAELQGSSKVLIPLFVCLLVYFQHLMVINAILITKTILIYTKITLLYMNAVYYKKTFKHVLKANGIF